METWSLNDLMELSRLTYLDQQLLNCKMIRKYTSVLSNYILGYSVTAAYPVSNVVPDLFLTKDEKHSWSKVTV